MESALMEQYDISQKGFLPDFCEKKFPNGMNKYKELLEKMNNISSDDFRNCIDKLDSENLPVIDNLSISECKLLYSTSCILAHKYIWCKGENEYKDIIPKYLSHIWYYSSIKLGIKPVLTHAAVDLWNWVLIDNSKPFSLDNIRSLYLILNDKNNRISEEWFYLIMVAIEGECGPILIHIENIHKLLSNKTSKLSDVINELYNISKLLDRQIEIISRIFGKCQPEIFYNKLRMYLWGSSKIENGVKLTGINIDNIKYLGGSAAQSSLIQVEDAFFGIEHNCNFLKTMQEYMPIKHKKYIERIRNLPSMHDYTQDFNNLELYEVYSNCVKKIRKFRNIHHNIVDKYIRKFIPPEKDETGTGGTSLSTFLKEKIQNSHPIKNSNDNDYIEFSYDSLTLFILISCFLAYAINYITVKYF